MNRLASILPPAQVLVGVDATSKKRAFEEAGLLFENLHGLSRALITDSLFARERLGSTGLGHGVAIPHGRIKPLKDALGALLRLSQPVPFDSPDGKPVSLAFVLLVPEKATEKHLQILSELAQMFSDKALREALVQAPDAAALHQLLTAWQPDAPGQRRAAA
jgi:PTS system nitrogen regulatory IIA component